jgi:predicted transcriptional regulator
MQINGDAFMKARKNKLLSVSELARLADVSAMVISNLEFGKRQPKIGSIKKIIQGLGLTIEEARSLRLIED